MKDNITIYVFTDPMMGLSYESEPVLEKLKAHFGDRLHFRYVMAGLVRDVSDFMTPFELAMPPEEGIRLYNKRLAGIYLGEEPIGGLPMNMEGFHLFDEDHRSSFPLDIAFHAARLAAPDKSEKYLYALRRATILYGRQTTKSDELVNVAKEAGIDENLFLEYFSNGQAETAFRNDLKLTQSLGIRRLPSYLIKTDVSSILICSMPSYNEFITLINQAEEKTIRHWY